MNIFARELVALLGEHKKELGSLYGLHSRTYRLLPSKVTRLKRSLTENITATLNADDLELLVKWLKLNSDGEEILRLRAALLAEMIRHLLGGRMNVAVADELGEVAFQVFIGRDPKLFLVQRAELLGEMRGLANEQHPRLELEDEEDILRGLDDEPVLRDLGDSLRGRLDDEQEAEVVSWGLTDRESDQAGFAASPIEPALEAAVEAYEQGALWLEIARDTRDPGISQGYLAQAHGLLHRARNLAAVAPTPKTEQEQEWLTVIGATLNVLPELPSDDGLS